MQSKLRSESVQWDDKQGRKTDGKKTENREESGTDEKRSHESARGGIDLNHPSFLLLSAQSFFLF